MSESTHEELVSTGTDAPEISSAAAAEKENKRTKRIQLSCTSCRHRKLKCNRLQPCENCVKRGQANSCHYANPGPRKTPAHARLSARNNELQQRLMHLEELVVSLSSRSSDSPESVAAAIQARQTGSQVRRGSSDEEGDSPGRMVTDQSGTRYADPSHWRAMLDELAHVKEYFDETDDDLEEEGEPQIYTTRSKAQKMPMLLGAVPAATKAELLSGIPSRSVVDLLVTRWFNGKEPGLICIHIPTFMKQYDRFWKDPRQASPAWVSILYSIIWLGTNFYTRTGEQPPSDVPADPEDLLEFYQKRAVQAIINMDYTSPGKLKVEALQVYFGVEYMQHRDAQSGSTFLMAIITRLAMLSGYHRDPKHFPNLSPFDGEMRRRAFALLRQLETLIAFQAGLPRQILDCQVDTESPRNLHNEDFDEDTVELPQSRPESERTATTYQVAKGRLMEVFGQISDRAFSREKTSYDEIMVLDMRTREAYDSLPSWLKMKPLNLCLTDPPELVMQRYNMQFLFHKARCVLHRRFFTAAAAVDPRSAYSKRICVESAFEILKHQKDLYDATQPGGILRHDSWYISSLTTHDFIMASMILCLWLSREAANQKLETTYVQMDSKELFQALDGSLSIWHSLKERSHEANKAADAMALMLRKTRAFRGPASMPDLTRLSSQNLKSGTSEINTEDTSSRKSHKSDANSQGTPGTSISLQEFPMLGLDNLDPNAFSIASDTLMTNADLNDLNNLNLDMDWASWDMQYRAKSVDIDLGDMSWMSNNPDLSSFPDLNLGATDPTLGQT